MPKKRKIADPIENTAASEAALQEFLASLRSGGQAIRKSKTPMPAKDREIEPETAPAEPVETTEQT